jgi:Fic family protein
MNHGLERLKSLPVSSRLIREIHGILLATGRGSEHTPGEFRRSQNWIGGTRPGNAFFVPPPADRVEKLMSDLEVFLHADHPSLPPLVKAGLAHVQFESIHPFLDGNGRLGRLLITFLLCSNGILRQPLLYLSLYFKTNRTAYYDLLTQVRQTGDWEAWLEFYLRGVKETAEQAVGSAERVLTLFNEDSTKIDGENATLLRVFQHAQANPYMEIPETARTLGVTYAPVAAALRRLSELKIMKEVTGKLRGRVFCYQAYLRILSEGTEPLV